MTIQHKPPAALQLVSRSEEGGLRLAFSGALTLACLPKAEGLLQSALKPLEQERAQGARPAFALFDLRGLSQLDSSGALLLNLKAESLRARGIPCEYTEIAEGHAELLHQAALPQGQGPAAREKKLPFPAALGKRVCDSALLLASLTAFLGSVLSCLGGLFRHPSRLRAAPLIYHMEEVGLKAVPIVSLLTFLIGLVVAYMGAQQLALFGADIFAVNLLEVTVLREMAVLITAIVVAGRSSSAFTAQIGAMVANQEVDALRSMGLNPLALLVAPRMLALILCLPMLVFIADIMALFGGAVAILFTINISFTAFITQLGSVAKLNNALVGLIKTPFFALAIGLIGCFHGFRATSSAESVGFLTTLSVVQSIFAVIVLDALFAIFFSTIRM